MKAGTSCPGCLVASGRREGEEGGNAVSGTVRLEVRHEVLDETFAARSADAAGPGELSGQHQPSAQGDGTILLFDNGRRAGRSRVLEIEPVTRAAVWQYEPGLFCEMAGGCERLADGTVLISDAQAGRAPVVDRDGRERWTWAAAPDAPPASRPGAPAGAAHWGWTCPARCWRRPARAPCGRG